MSPRALPDEGRRLELYHLDGRRVARLAADIAGQVGFYERNSCGNEAEALRFLHIRNLAAQLLKDAKRAANRYLRARP